MIWQRKLETIFKVTRNHKYEETDSINSVVFEVSSFVGNPVD